MLKQILILNLMLGIPFAVAQGKTTSHIEKDVVADAILSLCHDLPDMISKRSGEIEKTKIRLKKAQGEEKMFSEASEVHESKLAEIRSLEIKLNAYERTSAVCKVNKKTALLQSQWDSCSVECLKEANKSCFSALNAIQDKQKRNRNMVVDDPKSTHHENKTICFTCDVKAREEAEHLGEPAKSAKP